MVSIKRSRNSKDGSKTWIGAGVGLTFFCLVCLVSAYGSPHPESQWNINDNCIQMPRLCAEIEASLPFFCYNGLQKTSILKSTFLRFFRPHRSWHQSTLSGEGASQKHQREAVTTEHTFVTSAPAEQLQKMAKQRFSWTIDRDVMITGLFTACLFLLCREIKQSGALAGLDFASIPQSFFNVTHAFSDRAWNLIKSNEA